jgi:hypothetical protein
MAFQITLPSNVSDDGLFVNNKIGSYRTRLPTNLSLDSSWEVGLTEISYTKSWYNITSNQELCLVDGAGAFYQKDVMLSPGYYKDPEDLLHSLNKLLKDYKGDKIRRCPRFEFNTHSHKVSMVLGEDSLGGRVYCTMGDELRQLLGFEATFFEALFNTSYNFPRAPHTDISNPPPQGMETLVTPGKDIKASVEASNPLDINAGIHSLFVYCDIIKPTFVGDSYSNLLRVVKIPPNVAFGEQIVITYDKPQYFKLNTHLFDTIDLTIRDDSGAPIGFQFGRTITTFHFRQQDGAS